MTILIDSDRLRVTVEYVPDSQQHDTDMTITDTPISLKTDVFELESGSNAAAEATEAQLLPFGSLEL